MRTDLLTFSADHPALVVVFSAFNTLALVILISPGATDALVHLCFLTFIVYVVLAGHSVIRSTDTLLHYRRQGR